MLHHSRSILLATLLGLTLLATPSVRADQDAEIAIWLLKRATTPQRNGMHNVLLRALRQMKDPQLKPLFEDLAGRSEVSLQIHGALGLAELSEPQQLDLRYVLSMRSHRSQVQLVSAAMEAGLLNTENAQILLKSRQVDDRVRLHLLCYLVAQGVKVDLTQLLIVTQLEDESEAMLAWLLLLESGHQAALGRLESIAEMNALTRDQVLRHLMEKIVQYQFTKVGAFTNQWVLQVSQQSPSLQILILRAATYNPSRAMDDQYRRLVLSTDSLSQQVMLAQLALDKPKAFSLTTLQRLSDIDNPLISSLYLVSLQLHEKEDPTYLLRVPKGQVAELDAWMIRWAQQNKDEHGVNLVRQVLGELLKRGKMNAGHVQNLVYGAQYLMEHDSEAVAWIKEAFKTQSALHQEAMLMGLIRSRSPKAAEVIQEVKAFKSHSAMSMAALIEGRHRESMSENMMKELTLIVQGGAELRLPLRVQAAWIYLKHQGQAQVALKATLDQP